MPNKFQNLKLKKMKHKYFILSTIFFLIYSFYFTYIFHSSETGDSIYYMFLWVILGLIALDSLFIFFTFTFINEIAGRKIFSIQVLLSLIITEVIVFITMIVFFPGSMENNFILEFFYIFLFNGLTVFLLGFLLSFLNPHIESSSYSS